ncbi:hypothetical protein Mgra_00004100 [Meloidogyne graminicola]|uniref:Uncharacterized protein n=1 Tax=Meloidogyne graminicola TaxID=189291 RepID=A0A8S9ZU41_9BILA|nr:hypothetical protein Mgra_00004100 [Meloidogyne graminicola]
MALHLPSLFIGIICSLITIIGLAVGSYFLIKWIKKRRQKQEKDVDIYKVDGKSTVTKKKSKVDPKKVCSKAGGTNAMTTKTAAKVDPFVAGTSAQGVAVPLTNDSILTVLPKKKGQVIMETGIQVGDDKPNNVVGDVQMF